MNIIIAFVIFGIIVLIHEFGHFLFAKLSGVKVVEFSVGMGPRLFSINGKRPSIHLSFYRLAVHVRCMEKMRTRMNREVSITPRL